MKKITLALGIFLLCMGTIGAQTRSEILLEKGWKFSRNDYKNSYRINFDDSQWENVQIPHDWAIYGPFNSTNDSQDVAIKQDGQSQAQQHAGRTGGLPFVGVGWYRNIFSAPNFSENKNVYILFDGAMSNARVYVNGNEAGYWANGYNSFYFDITKFINKNGEKNVLAVRLENFTEQSRWYPGAGLYRNVHIIVTNKTHVPIWGTQITTPETNGDSVKIKIKTIVEGTDIKGKLSLYTTIFDKYNKAIETSSINIDKSGQTNDVDTVEQYIFIKNPKIWDTENPNLYTATTQIFIGNDDVDTYSTTFGIRTVKVVTDKGFMLNNKPIKFKGVCNHHDFGPLGAAVNDAAIRRQIRIIKDMGANAIRTSHNMPAPELVKACDEMGIMIMAETFDEWDIPKVKNGYNKYFNKWAKKDVKNLIDHYKNNPSVVMWCIGNEVEEQSAKDGVEVAKFLQDICHNEDPTRPVTNGMDRPDNVLANGMAAIMDIPGFNYRPFKYKEVHEKLPDKVILGSETASTVSSRGVYKFPVERKSMAKYPDHQASSYDVEHCGWSNLPEDDFIQHDDLSYCIGEFVWTGFDYLGEPTPYYSDWPSHSSLFGIVDLAGLPKDIYYLYRSHWNKKEKTLHVLPHWNWSGREGKITPIFVYTNYPSAEVFINGKSQGMRTKDTTVKIDGTYTPEAQKTFERQKRYRLMWFNTKYEPGTVKVVAYDENGKAAAKKEIKTAGEPYKIALNADRKKIKADGKDLAFITVSVKDKAGNECPNVSDLIKFKVSGEGKYRAGANGDPTCLDLFHLPQMHLFNGKLTAIIQSSEKTGKITLEATSEKLKKATIVINSK